MKPPILFISFTLIAAAITSKSFAQGVMISNDTAPPAPSDLLHT